MGLLSADSLPSSLQVQQAQDVVLSGRFPLVAKAYGLTARQAAAGDSYDASLNLFGVIPISTARVQVTRDDYVIPGGFPFGIKIFSDGVLVVGLNPVLTVDGTVDPAARAGLQKGDLILAVNDAAVSTNAQLQEQVETSGGQALALTVKRGEETLSLTLVPVLDSGGTLRAGLWVRDSAAGLGTMTFLDPQTGVYGGLGHAVCDADTGAPLSVLTGEIVAAEVADVQKAAPGTAGEIKGVLHSQSKIGSLLRNSDCGVYGRLYGGAGKGETVRVARKQEAAPGPASILACVEGEVRSYTCQIERVNFSDDTTQNLVIRVTDETLIRAAGGIVQGMSGSPVLQNGALIGAVTHVFVNDPTRGYGVFAQTMLAAARQTADDQTEQKAS